jgi:hypothetical protein
MTNKHMQGITDQGSKQDAEGEDNKPSVVAQPLPTEPSKADSSTNKLVKDKGGELPKQGPAQTELETTNVTVSNKNDDKGESNESPVVTQPLPSEPSKAESSTIKPVKDKGVEASKPKPTGWHLRP